MAYLCHFTWQQCMWHPKGNHKESGCKGELERTLHWSNYDSKTTSQFSTNHHTKHEHQEFVTELQFIKEEQLLFERNIAAKTRYETLKLHAFLPVGKAEWTLNFFILAESEKCRVTVLQENMDTRWWKRFCDVYNNAN